MLIQKNRVDFFLQVNAIHLRKNQIWFTLKLKTKKHLILKNVKPGQRRERERERKEKIYMWGSGEAFLFKSRNPFFSTEQIFLR